MAELGQPQEKEFLDEKDSKYANAALQLAADQGVVNVAYDDEYGLISVEHRIGLNQWRQLRKRLERNKAQEDMMLCHWKTHEKMSRRERGGQ